VHTAKAIGQNEMSRGRDIQVDPSNIGKGSSGGSEPQSAAMPPIAKLLWPCYLFTPQCRIIIMVIQLFLYLWKNDIHVYVQTYIYTKMYFEDLLNFQGPTTVTCTRAQICITQHIF